MTGSKEQEKKTLKLGIKVDASKVLSRSSSFAVEVRKKKRVATQDVRGVLSKDVGSSIQGEDSSLTKDEQMSRISAVKRAMIIKDQEQKEQPLSDFSIQSEDVRVKEKNGSVSVSLDFDIDPEQAVILDAKQNLDLNVDNSSSSNESNLVGESQVVDSAIEVQKLKKEEHQELKDKSGQYWKKRDKLKGEEGFVEESISKAKKVHLKSEVSSPVKSDKKFFEKKKSVGGLASPVSQEDLDEDEVRPKIRISKRKKTRASRSAKLIRSVVLVENMSIASLAIKIGESVKSICKFLTREGLAKVEDRLDGESVILLENAALVVEDFGHSIKKIVKKNFDESDLANLVNVKKSEEKLRAPIVTVMGHVDHGKTSLLDALRSTDVASGEHGGITQSIGAYTVTDEKGQKITFIDTPGHEAFSAMRMRGASVTDIVVLVVAADDGIKEQTVEAINHAKLADVQIIVAVNKMDKDGADYDKVLRELLQHDVIVESFGGSIISIPVSAKTGENLTELKVAILLSAEMLELKAPYDCPAVGVVIESKLDKSMGVLATLLVKAGQMKVGDVILSGVSAFGKVRLLMDWSGKHIKEASVSEPVRVVGFNAVPTVGDTFRVVESEKVARNIINHNVLNKKDVVKTDDKLTDMQFFADAFKAVKTICFIVKTDTVGSREAIADSLLSSKANTSDEVYVKIIHSGVGVVSVSDVTLAATLKDEAVAIFAFNVPIDIKASMLAKQCNVKIYSHTVIYDLIDRAKLLIKSLITPKMIENVLGKAEVRAIFSSNRNGSVVGCYVLSGKLKRGASIRLVRKGEVLHSGVLKVLKRFTEDVKEVKSGFECGVFVTGTFVPESSDVIECYVTEAEESAD